MNMRRLAVACVVMSVCLARAGIETAGDLLLSVEVSSLSALTNGETVAMWANAGTLGGSFFPAVSGQGAVYQTDVAGAAAVTFAGSANSVMTNSVMPPESILSNNIWSAEVWVLNPVLTSPEDQLSWTDRGNWTGSANGQCMEIRYCSDANNGVEHYGGDQNIQWSGNPPLAGIWHHVVITRDTNGVERLYADGVLRTTKTPPVLNLRGGGRFALGGVWDRGGNNWTMLFSGSLGNMRVHDGTLTSEQVINNYVEERALYQACWSGAVGEELPWADAGNWQAGNVGENGEAVTIDNGGTALLTGSLTLKALFPVSGGLTVSNGAALAVDPRDNVYVANGASFNLKVLDGRLVLPGSSTVNLYMGQNGGDATVTVGGAGGTALLDVDRDTILANSSGSTGVMSVGAGAEVYNSNGYFYVANTIGATGQLTVDGGMIGFRQVDKNFVVNVNGAQGEVTVNSGSITATGDFQWSAGTSTNVAAGTVYLNGGRIEAKRLYAVTTAGANVIYLNGGTVRAVDSRTDFMFGLTAAYLRSGGVTFDIPSGVTGTAAQGLTEDASSTGGGISKAGAGRLTLSGANTVTGDIDVQAGDLFFNNAGGLPGGYAGTVTVANDGSIGYNAAGGATLLANQMGTGSSGYLTLFANNTADNVDFSSLPGMKLAFQGIVNYTGTFTPYQGQYTFRVEGTTVTNTGALADNGAYPGHLSITGVSNAGMVLTGDSSFTGGAEIDAATVSMRHANALGVQGTPGVPDVELRNGAVLRFDAAMDLNAFVTNRLTADSVGILLVGAANAAQSIDLSAHPGIVIGSAELNLDYSGTLTPAAGIYHLGGGSAVYTGPDRGFSVGNLADSEGVSAVVIGTPGLVELKAGNSYSGGTVVTNRGVLFLKEDGLGAVPEAPDAANLYVNNGVVRGGNANFTLNANRGVSVGTDGMTLHPWGGFTMTIAGNLSGSGKITTTDSGTVTFGGAGNTYNGNVDIGAGRYIRVGDGANFSWASTGGVTDNGTLYLKTDGESSFGDTISGSGVVRKEGTGALTLTAPSGYAGTTYVDAGLLRVSATNVLPRGSGKGMVMVAAGAGLDVAGGDMLVSGLNGAGVVTNSAGGSGTLYVGEASVTGSFSGTVDPSVSLVKISGNTQALANTNAAAADVTVEAGTLKLAGSTRVTGTVAVSAGANLLVSAGEGGLYGEFYKLSSAPAPADFVSLAALEAFLSGKTPNYVTNSTYLGASFDMGATGAGNSKFPAGYNTNPDNLFALRWTGLFYAETAGDYGFATASDDGSMVFVDGAVACDNNAMQSYSLADSNTVGTVTLTQGFHQIVIAMYENSGDQGLTVWMTPPGGSQAVLPMRLLSTRAGGTDGAHIASLSGAAGGTVTLEDGNGIALTLTGDSDMTFNGAIIASNANSRVIKQGAGTLVLSSGGSDQFGTFDVQSGSLVLTNGASKLGTLTLANGVETKVYGQLGLTMQFFNRSTSDANYGTFASLSAWKTYLSTNFPSGPNYVTNSLMLGTNLDTGTAGTAWPTLYVQGTGTEQETYDAYWFGRIYLDRAGAYTFGTQSDDGSGLFIDGALVVNNGYNQGITTPARYGTITLGAGFHDIDIPYRENTGGNALRVYIAYPGGTTNLMPQSILFSGASLRGLAGEAGGLLDLGTAAVLLDQSAATTYAGDLAGSKAGVLQKVGLGTLTLTGENPDFAGRYTVTEGTLRVGDGGMAGSLGATASVSVGAEGTLLFNRDGTVTVSGEIMGNGLLVIDGPGEVYVTSTNAFEGTVLVNSGRLTFAPGARLGPDAVITNAATLEVETSSTRVQTGLMGAVSGTGGLEVTGSGTLVLNNSNAYTGVTRVSAGATLLATRPLSLDGGGDVALDGGTLALQLGVEAGTNILVSALNTNTWTRNGVASWVTRYGSQWVQLTASAGNQSGSVFCATSKIDPGACWSASFRYEVGAHTYNAADGMAFLLQNDSDGAAALGMSGGSLGINTISPSIGLFFNLYNAASVGWIVDGAKYDAVTALNGIIPTNGVDVTLAYDGANLKLTLIQGERIYSATRTVDLDAKFGGNTVFVGFAGATGGSTAQQFVGNFALAEAVPIPTDYANTVTVAENLTGALKPVFATADASVSFAGLNIGPNATLNVSAAAGSKADTGYTVAASNVVVASGTATVHLAANGAGAGVLALDTLAVGSGAKLVVTGAVSVPGGVLTVVVPTPVPRGVTQLADFTAATWVGDAPVIVLVDENGDPLDEKAFLRSGKLYINTITGTLVIFR